MAAESVLLIAKVLQRLQVVEAGWVVGQESWWVKLCTYNFQKRCKKAAGETVLCYGAVYKCLCVAAHVLADA